MTPLQRPFETVLVANRGEIACRVLRTARRLGYRSVAVHSDADADARHVHQADCAVRLGPAPAAESYLSIAAVVDAARRAGADAVHPGYGFLSERADFARACADAGLVFIGPPADAIDAMGDKARAKRRMLAAGVPCAPGYLGEHGSDDATLMREAARLGLPLLVKAVAGGGGRGMRLVHDLAALPAALDAARREAGAAFGDGAVMLERLIEHGRHVEVQVFADAHGGCLHLGERDCSAQRRRQKLLEEAPAPALDEAQRAALGADAVAAARAVGYVGAGTVEFIVDAQGRHHFLEMNTRLQVEHPVTECVTGLDLVEWQLRIAAGEPLPLRQHDIRRDGHAIEVRLYAEDPYDGFRPHTGRIAAWAPGDAGVRVDHGVVAGDTVTPWYDALLAKFVAHGRDRGDAIRRLVRALDDAPLFGVATNARLLRDLLRHADFRAARLTTTRIDEWAAAGAPPLQRPLPPEDAWRVAAAVLGGSVAGRPAGVAGLDLRLRCGAAERSLRTPLDGVLVHGGGGVVGAVERDRDGVGGDGGSAHVGRDGDDDRGTCGSHDSGAGGAVAAGSGGGAFGRRRGHGTAGADAGGAVARWVDATVDGVRRRWPAHRDAAGLHLASEAAVFVFAEVSPYPAGAAARDARRALAPVAGVVARVAVRPGERVEAGQPLVCIEAMKMETWLVAATAGTVRVVHAQVQRSVAQGAVLVDLALDDDEDPAGPPPLPEEPAR